jgi:hypothetical protein
LQELQARASNSTLDARNVQLLREEVTKLEAALRGEQARSEKQAEAFASLARSCDNRALEQEAQYKETIAKLEALVAAKDATIAAQQTSLTEQAVTHATTAADSKKQLFKLESRCDAIIAAKAAHVTLLKKQIVALEASHVATVATLGARHAAALAAKDAAAADLRTALADLGAALASRDRELAVLRAETTAHLADLKASHAATVAAKDAAAADLQIALATREREHAALRADSAAQLAAIHAAVTSTLALEVHAMRSDGRQFATLHVGPVPFDELDTAWCAAACGNKWKIDIDPVTHTRAHVKRHERAGHVTLRRATPLPRRVPSTGASSQQLPSFRVVIEAYPAPVDGKGDHCDVGFVPSHTAAHDAPVPAVPGRNIHHYGGWSLQVKPAVSIRFTAAVVVSGWKPLPPHGAESARTTWRLGWTGSAAAAEDVSAYATTVLVPPVPEGSAVELAVDYAAGTCRVAFYTPAAVAGGFIEAPYQRMELRFVATAAEDVPKWGAIPARSVPTITADSRMQLYPAVSPAGAGAVFRFV